MTSARDLKFHNFSASMRHLVMDEWEQFVDYPLDVTFSGFIRQHAQMDRALMTFIDDRIDQIGGPRDAGVD